MDREIVTLERLENRLSFIKDAIEHMNASPTHASFARDGYIALRWGMQERSLLVMKMDDEVPSITVQDALDSQISKNAYEIMSAMRNAYDEKQFDRAFRPIFEFIIRRWDEVKDNWTITGQSHDADCACIRCVMNKIAAHLERPKPVK